MKVLIVAGAITAVCVILIFAITCAIDFLGWIWRGLMIVADGLSEVVVRKSGRGGYY